MTYDQQIDRLEKEKNLIIEDREYAKEILKRTSYYSLIGGYKDNFKNSTTKKYKDGTTFEDIVALYSFDEELRELFLKYLMKVEGQVKSYISYSFTEKHGERQQAYLDVNNYNNISRNKWDINKLIGVLARYTSHSTEYKYINHSQRKYNNVPLWVLIKALTFGNISKLYMLLTQDIQIKVSKNYLYINEKQLEKLLAVSAKFRNVCAHGERLFSYKTKDSIPDFNIHKKLGIPKKGMQYIWGKNDLFAVVIALRYLLSKDSFIDFKIGLNKIIKKYLHKSKYFEEKQFLNHMGFPDNWRKITSYRVY